MPGRRWPGWISPPLASCWRAARPCKRPAKTRGVVFQKHALLPWLNVIDNVAFGLKLRGTPMAEREERALHFLQLAGLAGMVAGYACKRLGGYWA